MVEQAGRLAADGAVTAWSALRLHGARFFDGQASGWRRLLPVPVVCGPGGRVRSDSSAEVSREPVEVEEVVIRCGVPVTTPQRALFDEMRRVADWREPVVAMDLAVAAGLVSISQMEDYLADRTAWRRARLVRYDGAGHLRTTRLSGDIRREEAMRRLGLEYFDVLRPDRAAGGLAERMRATRSRAAFADPAERAWMIVPPAGWPREPSPDERLFVGEMAVAMERDVRVGPL